MSKLFGHCADWIAKATGHPLAFLLCVAIVAMWAITGPVFNYSDTWQLLINTGTTIVTFLMVFLIQNTQNRDTAAMQAKLDELIRSSAAHNHFIGIEHLPQEEVEAFRTRCSQEAGKRALGRVNELAESAADKAHDF